MVDEVFVEKSSRMLRWAAENNLSATIITRGGAVELSAEQVQDVVRLIDQPFKVWLVEEKQESGYVGPCTVYVGATEDDARMFVQQFTEYRQGDFSIREVTVSRKTS